MNFPADGDDLYGDLSNTSRAAGSAKKSSAMERPETQTALCSETQKLEEKVKDLSEENENLKRNIGTLFRTAKAEIKRKDDEIARLLRQIEDSGK